MIRFRVFIAACVFLLYFAGLGHLGLIGPDEPRYAQVAREMLRTHDFVTPHLNGEPWFEKPPLYYWMAAASFAVFGVNEWAARLPCALAASCFLILFGWAADRLFHGETARYAVLALTCSAGWLGFARAASPEMLFTVASAGALMLLGLWLWSGRDNLLYGVYGLLALSMLAKGPTAIVVCGLVLALYCMVIKEGAWLFRVLRPGPLLLFGIVALPWYLAVYMVNGIEFLRVFFWRHHFQRFMTPELAHPGAPWYYLPVLLALVFPWTPQLALIAMDVADVGWRGLARDHRRVFMAAWIIAPLLFFSASQGKLPGYVLVIVPAFALWIGHALAHTAMTRIRRTFLAQALLLPVVLAASGALPEALSRGLRDALAQLAAKADPVLLGLGAGGGLLVALLAWRARRLAASVVVCAVVALGVARMVYLLGPAIDRLATARPVAEEIRARGISPEQLTLSPLVPYQRRELQYGLEFYLDRHLPVGGNLPWVVTPDGRIEQAQ